MLCHKLMPGSSQMQQTPSFSKLTVVSNQQESHTFMIENASKLNFSFRVCESRCNCKRAKDSTMGTQTQPATFSTFSDLSTGILCHSNYVLATMLGTTLPLLFRQFGDLGLKWDRLYSSHSSMNLRHKTAHMGIPRSNSRLHKWILNLTLSLLN